MVARALGDRFYVRKVEYFRRGDHIADKEVLVVGGLNNRKWAHFKCPCGCKDVVSLSLMKTHGPNWILRVSAFGQPTLYPSVWKKDGCESHFWIRKGNVIWHKE
jgi:hypothetical protein